MLSTDEWVIRNKCENGGAFKNSVTCIFFLLEFAYLDAIPTT